jgi:hypothetical protein
VCDVCGGVVVGRLQFGVIVVWGGFTRCFCVLVGVVVVVGIVEC